MSCTCRKEDEMKLREIKDSCGVVFKFVSDEIEFGGYMVDSGDVYLTCDSFEDTEYGESMRIYNLTKNETFDVDAHYDKDLYKEEIEVVGEDVREFLKDVL